MIANQSTPNKLAAQVVELVRERMSSGDRVVFISGAQGIGKTTALQLVGQELPEIAMLSLDDFYLDRASRSEVAEAVHPLFDTRGPPGTHDIKMLDETITKLLAVEREGAVRVPVFDKTIDDRRPPSEWRRIDYQPALIVVEGWMMGVRPDFKAPSAMPLNEIEKIDVSGAWREHQERALSNEYSKLFDRADSYIHILAPSFNSVLKWRIEQEESNLGLAEGTLPFERREWVSRFIQHYERLTSRMLEGGRRAGFAIPVDDSRQVLRDTPTFV